MPVIKEVKLANGRSFFIEVEDAHLDTDTALPDTKPDARAPIMPHGAEPTSIISDTISGATTALGDQVDAITGRISAALEYIQQEFEENPPDELVIELSVALKGKGAIPVILSGETSAAFKVTAKWVQPKKEKESA